MCMGTRGGWGGPLHGPRYHGPDGTQDSSAPAGTNPKNHSSIALARSANGPTVDLKSSTLSSLTRSTTAVAHHMATKTVLVDQSCSAPSGLSLPTTGSMKIPSGCGRFSNSTPCLITSFNLTRMYPTMNAN